MSNYKFGKPELDILLKKALNNQNNSYDNLKQIQNDLNTALQESLKLNEWSLEHFLALDIGFRCLQILELPKYEPDPNYPAHNGVCIVRIKTMEEIKNTLEEADDFFTKRLQNFKLSVKENEIPDPNLPIKWLEFSRKMLPGNSLFERMIIANMDNLIRFAHYKISPELAEKKIFPVSIYTLKEAAEELGLSENELITECFTQEFGVYVMEGKYHIQQGSQSSITQDYISEFADFSYIYPYEGFIRLQKTSMYCPNNTLKEIYKGGNIEFKPSSNYMVPLQLSLAEFAQGISKFIILKDKVKITREDLVFIKDEILAYKEKRAKSVQPNIGNKIQAKTKSKHTNVLHELINEIHSAAEEKSAMAIWNQLKQLAQNHDVLQEISPWTIPTASISWITHRGTEKTLKRRGFENYISKLNTAT